MAWMCLRLHRAAIHIRCVGPLRFVWCDKCKEMR